TLRVTRKAQTLQREVNWEIWNDAKNSRVRQFLADANQSIPLPANSSTKDQARNSERELISELEQVLKANQMDPAHPLSAVSYQSWHNTLQAQRDEITKTKLADGADALSLRTVPAAAVRIGQIVEAVFVVRAKDWLPTELRLDVASESGTR